MKSNTYHIFFTNLANPLKINIIASLNDSDKNVSEICRELKIDQSKASHALAVLKKCHIVEMNKQGKERVYSLNKKTITPILKIIDRHSESFCDCKGCKGCKQ
jgi:DNA-binding transcriptional ArsR family regulator